MHARRRLATPTAARAERCRTGRCAGCPVAAWRISAAGRSPVSPSKQPHSDQTALRAPCPVLGLRVTPLIPCTGWAAQDSQPVAVVAAQSTAAEAAGQLDPGRADICHEAKLALAGDPAVHQVPGISRAARGARGDGLEAASRSAGRRLQPHPGAVGSVARDRRGEEGDSTRALGDARHQQRRRIGRAALDPRRDLLGDVAVELREGF